MEIQAQESAFEKAHIPEGIHPAELVAVSDTSDGQYGPRVALDFNVYHSKNKAPAKIGRVFGKKLTPKSKLWEAFSALGKNPEIGNNFNTDEIIGKPCRVMVEDYNDIEGNTVSGITKVKEAGEEALTYIAEVKQTLQKTKDGEPVDVVETEEFEE